MNATKTEIVRALDWFDENYDEAIDDENITEICTWMKTLNNMYGASLPLGQDAYYMAFIYILYSFPQSEIEKHREELGIFTYVLVSLKHGVKSFDFSNYSYGSPRSVANFLDIGSLKGYPTTITIDDITIDLSGDGAEMLKLLRYLPGKTRKIHTVILNQDPSGPYSRRGLQQPIMVYGVMLVDTLIINNFVGINFYSAPFSLNTLKLNGTCDLLDIKLSEKDSITGNTYGINFNVLDLTGLKDDSITLSPNFQTELAINPGGSGNRQIIKRRNQKIIVNKKFVENIKPLIKTV